MYKNYLYNIFQDELKSIIEKIKKKSKTENEMNKYLNDLRKFINNNTMHDEMNNIKQDMTKNFLLKVDKRYKQIEKDDERYQKHIKQIWNSGLKLSTCLYDFLVEILQKYNYILESEHQIELEEYKFKIKALQLLSNRSLQTFKSILILVNNGMGDNAFKLCRSLHENWIIATFINQNNEETAKAFIMSSDSDIEDYNNDYEWVRSSGLFSSNERITFNKIFKCCNFDDDYANIWKIQYKKQCKLLHATPQGTTSSLCLPPNLNKEIALIGQSPYGLNIPAEHAAIYLVQTVSKYLMVVDNQWSLLITSVLFEILNIIQNKYTILANKMNK